MEKKTASKKKKPALQQPHVKRRKNYELGEITPAMIEALPNYIGKHHSSILEDVMTGKKSKDTWNFTYKDNVMRIGKGSNISWAEVLTIIKKKIVQYEQKGK